MQSDLGPCFVSSAKRSNCLQMFPQVALVGFRMILWYAPCQRFASYIGFPIRRFCLRGRVFSWRMRFGDRRCNTKSVVPFLSCFEKDHYTLAGYFGSKLVF